jgi:nicotinate-nucleotide pyrophosphorylase (carboxylating)
MRLLTVSLEPPEGTMTMLTKLPDIMIEPVVRAALLEDLGRAGDITSDAVVPADAQARALLVAREPGTVAGLDFARMAFALLDARITVNAWRQDGARLKPGDIIAEIVGPARAILSGERVALNFLGHLSGIASATDTIADAITHTRTKISCTGKLHRDYL